MSTDPLAQVRTVETCKCSPDCHEIPTAGRNYAWGHAPKKANKPAEPFAMPEKLSGEEPRKSGRLSFVDILATLRAERSRLDEAIIAIEKLI